MRIDVKVNQREFEKRVARMGISYSDLAKQLKISRQYMSLIKDCKQNARSPSVALRNRMLKVLKCKFDDIFQFVDME